MADTPDLTPDRLREQASRHLEALAAAGVQFLPRPSAEPPSLPARSAALSPEPIMSASDLFSESTPEPSADERRTSLTVLAEKVAGCTRCDELASTRTQTVFGVGPIDPELCLVGEAPGRDEDRAGEPFVGAAGQMLNRIIAACGLKREDIFICNILRCRPPGNRQPKQTEADHCREWLESTLALVKPKFICALGATAAQHLLKVKTPIGRLRGRFYDLNGIPVICTFHPASLLEGRSPEKKKDVWEDMKMLLTRMGRPIPQGKKSNDEG